MTACEQPVGLSVTSSQTERGVQVHNTALLSSVIYSLSATTLLYAFWKYSILFVCIPLSLHMYIFWINDWSEGKCVCYIIGTFLHYSAQGVSRFKSIKLMLKGQGMEARPFWIINRFLHRFHCDRFFLRNAVELVPGFWGHARQTSGTNRAPINLREIVWAPLAPEFISFLMKWTGNTMHIYERISLLNTEITSSNRSRCTWSNVLLCKSIVRDQNKLWAH